MEKVVIAAASNIDHIEREGRKSKFFLNGAAIYSGYASAMHNDTRVITCVGDETQNKEIVEAAKSYKENKLPIWDIICIENGSSFKQTFEPINGKLEVTNKDYGNYNDWEPEIVEFETDTLLLGTGNPVFQKKVLDACKSSKNILLDSKLIHLQKRFDKVNELLKRVDTFLGTKQEVEQILKNCNLPITMTSALFEVYPNLKTIVEKNAEKGGRVFTQDGIIYRYEPVQPSKEICVDGAGDIFAGTYASMLTKNADLKEVIRKSAQVSAESVKHFGIGKIKLGLIENPEINIRIEESRWKSKDGKQENKNRSD